MTTSHASLSPAVLGGRRSRPLEGPWALTLARFLVPLAALVVTTGRGWPGPAGVRAVWAGAIAAELALTFKPSRAWASAAALGAGVMAWLIWG